MAFIYDLEVFKDNFMVAILDQNTNKRFLYLEPNTYGIELDGVTMLDRNQMTRFMTNAEYNIIGFNNYGYDDYILQAWLNGNNPRELKEVSDYIINGGDVYKLPKGQFVKSLDTKQQLKPSDSLKTYEGGKGGSIIEAKEFFDIDRPLTEDELQSDILPYVFNDVEATSQLFTDRRDYFESKKILVEMTNNRPEAIKYNTTTLSAKYLVPKQGLLEDVFTVNNIDELPDEVADVFKKYLATGDPFASLAITVEALGLNISFGIGGLHSIHDTPRSYDKVRTADVTSMYPNIIIRDNLLNEYTNKFAVLVTERIKNKKANPSLAGVQKIIINSVYGLLKSQYSTLFAPKVAISVTFSGQIALYTLAKRLYRAGATIVQLNTDGVYYQDNGHDVSAIFEAWEAEYLLKLEDGLINKLIQKDVNNYIGIKDGGKVKVKGKDFTNITSINPFNVTIAPIVNRAIYANLLYGTNPNDFIKQQFEDGNYELFYFVAKRGVATKYVENATTGERLQAVNRVIATNTGIKLMQVRANETRGSFPDYPEALTIHNANNTELPAGVTIDLDYYKTLVSKRLMLWANVEDLELNELTKTALYYHKNGLKVIPINKTSKAPLMKFAGVKPFKTEAEVISYFMFNDVNIAIATSNLTVIDIDNHTGDGLAVFNNEFTDVPETITATTASGGKHLIYANRINTQIVGFRANVDIKANTNNYILVYPSTTSKGIYKFDNIDFNKSFKSQVKKLPSKNKLLEAIKEAKKVVKINKGVQPREVGDLLEVDLLHIKKRANELLQTAQVGGRNIEMFKFASWLNNVKGIHGDTLAEILHGYNEQLANPLPSNEVASLAKKFK